MIHSNTRLEAKFEEFNRTQNEMLCSVQALAHGRNLEVEIGLEEFSAIDQMFPLTSLHQFDSLELKLDSICEEPFKKTLVDITNYYCFYIL